MDTKLPLSSVPSWALDAGNGFVLDRAFGTMAIRVATVSAIALPPVTILPTNTAVFAIRGTVPLENAAALAASFRSLPAFVGVFSDPPLYLDYEQALCPLTPIGSYRNVIAATGTEAASSGRRVLLAFADIGFDSDLITRNADNTIFNSDLSFVGANATGPAGAPISGHGNMVAYDATLIATRAALVDLRTAKPMQLRLSDAQAAYNYLYKKVTDNNGALKQQYDGLVVSNSWGLGAKDNQFPPGSVERYFDNPNHPFTLAVKRLVAERVDVVFSAGDSGSCSDGDADGQIWGANSLDEVISVAAVGVNNVRERYSSRGPGAFGGNQKPDVSSYAEFTGSDDGDHDSGTSAAAAVTAGVVAAIRAQAGWDWRTKTAKEVKDRLIEKAQKSVRDVAGQSLTLTGWNRDFGFGIARVP